MPPLTASRSFYVSPLETLIARPQLNTRAGASIPTDTSLINTRLPAEILTRTFISTLDTTTSHTDRVRMMLSLTWVCRKWRELMISYPMLWATITGTEKPEMLEAFLERSQQIPLTVIRNVHHSIDAHDYVELVLIDNATRVLRHLNRIKTIDACFLADDGADIETLLAQHAPSLEVLQLAFVADNSWRRELELEDGADAEEDDVELIPTFDETLFGGQRPPKLRHIEFSRCALDWSSPVLSGVTKLEMDSQPVTPQYEHFITALSNMQALEIFTMLRNGLPELTGNRTLSDYPVDAVELPNLREVILQDDLDACALFLRAVACNLSFLKIDSDTEDTSSALYETFFDLCTARLQNHFNKCPLFDFKGCTWITEEGNNTIGCNGYTALIEDDTTSLHGMLTLSSVIRLPTDTPPDIESILTAAFEHLPVQKVLRLDLRLTQPCSPRFWMTTLPLNVPLLAALSLTPVTFRAFFEAYYHKHVVASADERTLSEIPFAHLSSVSSVSIPSDLREMVNLVIAHRDQKGFPLKCLGSWDAEVTTIL